MNKRNITRTLAIAIGLLTAHFCMDIFNMGIKDGKATAHQTVQKIK